MDHGFHIITGVLAPREITELRTAVESMPRGRAGTRNVLSHPVVRTIAGDARLLRLAADMLDAPAVPFKATLFDKSPASNWLVTWHQDLALPMRRRCDVPGWGPWTEKSGLLHALAPAEVLARVVALRVHLDDSTALNGPLRVLPDTHREGRLSEAQIAVFVHNVTPVDCVVPAGGVIAMRPLVLHASSKSTSALPRRVIHIEYAADMALGSGLELAVA